jgi:hypothetical protein
MDLPGYIFKFEVA